MPESEANFEGMNNIAGVLPPDTCGDVGPNHYVQAVNFHFQVFAKNGISLLGALPINSPWNCFGGVCETLNNGDPIVLYDQWADRCLISQFALNYGGQGFLQCIAISATGDPAGTWHRYDYFMSDTLMNDYPKFGVWPDGYYMSINQFNAASGYAFAGQGVAVFGREKMLAGQAAAMQYINASTLGAGLMGMLPSDADGLRPQPLASRITSSCSRTTIAVRRRIDCFCMIFMWTGSTLPTPPLFRPRVRPWPLHLLSGIPVMSPRARDIGVAGRNRRPVDVPPAVPQLRRSCQYGGQSYRQQRQQCRTIFLS